jgi:hypothetical protein
MTHYLRDPIMTHYQYHLHRITASIVNHSGYCLLPETIREREEGREGEREGARERGREREREGERERGRERERERERESKLMFSKDKFQNETNCLHSVHY